MEIRAVLDCDASSTSGGQESFHRFPKSSPIRKLWAKFCRIELEDNKSPLVCSRHFAPDSFKIDFRPQLLNSKPRRSLILGGVNLNVNNWINYLNNMFIAVPSIRGSDGGCSKRGERALKKDRKLIVQELLAAKDDEPMMETVCDTEHQPAALELHVQEQNAELLGFPCCPCKDEVLRLKQENLDLRRTIKVLEGEIQVANSRPIEMEKIKGMFGNVLTRNQIDSILGIKKRISWSEDELSKAFTLR